jgi:hypothetical protein
MAMRQGKIGKGAADGIGLSAAQVQGRNAAELASERSCALTRSCGDPFDLAQIRHEIRRLRQAPRENGEVADRAGGSGRMEYDIEALAGSWRNEIARE